MDKHFDANRPCQAVSKQFIKHYKPEKPTLLIAINDFNDQFKPFKEHVNYVTYSKTHATKESPDFNRERNW